MSKGIAAAFTDGCTQCRSMFGSSWLMWKHQLHLLPSAGRRAVSVRTPTGSAERLARTKAITVRCCPT